MMMMMMLELIAAQVALTHRSVECLEVSECLALHHGGRWLAKCESRKVTTLTTDHTERSEWQCQLCSTSAAGFT
uniref:Putative secreted peptide n=1 Tax=Anopheles braziliensis TaxID=58242 RepID=A0A2M3ZUN8_9DIPT